MPFAMASALPRSPDTFRIPFTGARHRTTPIHFGRLKMASALEPNVGRLSATFNGGQRKITFSAKAEHNKGGNSLDDSTQESEYLVGHESSDYERVNVWWDAGSCPPPLNFDVSKIGNTIVEFLRRNFNTSRPIYLHVYGNLGELLPNMAKDTIRIMSESGFKFAGFELKDDGIVCYKKYFGKERTLMTEDLFFCGYGKGAQPIHMVILDGKVITASALEQFVDLDRCCLICVEPEQESVDGVWHWKPLSPDRLSLMMGQCGSGNSSDEGELSDDASVNTFQNDKIVSIWWDFKRFPLPLNFNAPKIANNITKALRRLNLLGGSICFNAYGNIEEIGEDIVRLVCESGFQIASFRFDDGKRTNISLVEDVNFDLSLQLYFSRPSPINIVISDGRDYSYVSLNTLCEARNIIMPFEVLLDEDSQGGALLDDLLEEYGVYNDDENILEGGHFGGGLPEDWLKYVKHGYDEVNNCANIWWDVDRCPPPSNFDISKIGITITKFLEDWTHPVYLHVYGNLSELLPKMVNNTIRIFSQSSLKLEGFEVKDNSNVSDFILAGFQQKRKYFSNVMEENLMMDDLIYHKINNHTEPRGLIQMVVLDGKVITKSTMYRHRLREECLLVCLVPEEDSINGGWRWKPVNYWE